MLRLSSRLELFFLGSIPTLITLLLTVLYLIPKHMAGLSSVMPMLPLLAAFYWSIQQSRAIPYWLMFLIGLVIDAVTSQVLGLSSLLFMLFLYMIGTQRRILHKEGFLIKWICFSVVFLVIMALKWLLLSWYYTQGMPFVTALVQWVLTAACYPIAHKVFDLLEHYLHARKWDILHG